MIIYPDIIIKSFKESTGFNTTTIPNIIDILDIIIPINPLSFSICFKLNESSSLNKFITIIKSPITIGNISVNTSC